VAEVEYNVVSTVLLATITLEEVAGVIVLNESDPAEVEEAGLVLDNCSELILVGSMCSVLSVELIAPVEIMVDKLVEEEVVPSVTTGITTGEVFVKVARVESDEMSDGEVGWLGLFGASVGSETTEDVTTEVPKEVVAVISTGLKTASVRPEPVDISGTSELS